MIQINVGGGRRLILFGCEFRRKAHVPPYPHPNRRFGTSKKAIHEGVALAKAVGAHVTGVTVSAPWHVFAVEPAAITDIADTYAKRMTKTSAERLEVIKNAAAASGVKCDTITVEDEHPYHAIIDTAEKHGCDAIVMASHGRHGLSAVVLGSETVKVLTHSKIPVVVCR